ncbi:glycine betaine ABC transporter substrate-binding protein [Kozakia baliensis]|uniref:glycine betaine ABC transporter substrate-binding protein n=1 Tax=Kozakia baliensis TaxID=153496 RepID=UPI00087CF603|nr:glycine betaine ABC transporter substrate-binding protein [Kozakia baliensis]AOX20120.1 hypothetical protein A0U90_07275 [Kozakia baliensis]
MTAITLGHLRDALHAGCASAVARVLDAYEVEVDFVDADADELPGMLDNGEIDLLVSAWLPRDAGFVQHGMRLIGLLYRPVYVWASTKPLGPIDTLTSEQVGRFITVSQDAPRLKAALAMLPNLAGTPVETCDEEVLYERVSAAAEAGEALVAMIAQPHALFHTDMLHVLEDAQERLGGEMEARMMVRETVAACADSDMLDELSEMTLGNKVMSALDYTIQVEGVDPEDAAEAWQRGRLVPR